MSRSMSFIKSSLQLNRLSVKVQSTLASGPHWSAESVHRFHIESVQVPALINSPTCAAQTPPRASSAFVICSSKVKEKSEIAFNENDEDSDGGKESFALVLLAL